MSEIEAERFATMVSQAVLDRLGNRAPDWRVLDVARNNDERLPSPPADLPPVRSLRITLGRPGAPEDEVVVVHFSLDAAREVAVLALANQIQDHAIEATGGLPLPPCPGHAHPMSPTLLAGSVAVWSCPVDPERPHFPVGQAHPTPRESR